MLRIRPSSNIQRALIAELNLEVRRGCTFNGPFFSLPPTPCSDATAYCYSLLITHCYLGYHTRISLSAQPLQPM
jgi:hypothetical protein